MPQNLFSASRVMDGIYRALVVETLSGDNGVGATVYIPALHRQQMPFKMDSQESLELLPCNEETGEFEKDLSNNISREVSMRKQDYPFAPLISWDAQPSLNVGDKVMVMFENADSGYPVIISVLGSTLPLENPLLSMSAEGAYSNISGVDSVSIQAYLNTIGGQPALNWYNPGNGSQCTELARDYVVKVFKLEEAKSGALGNGKDMYRKVPERFPQIFQSIKYSANLRLMPGDIISLRGSQLEYGHVGLVKSVNGNSYELLEQWAGSGTIRIATCNFPGSGNRTVIGVARPIVLPPTESASSPEVVNNIEKIQKDIKNGEYTQSIKDLAQQQGYSQSTGPAIKN